MKFLWKGKLVEQQEMNIDFNDRGYQFGDVIYEFVRVYNGKLFALLFLRPVVYFAAGRFVFARAGQSLPGS